MALRAMLDNDQNEQRNSDEGKHRPYTARETEDAFVHGTSDDAQDVERRSVMPARSGLAQPSRRLPIAAI